MYLQFKTYKCFEMNDNTMKIGLYTFANKTVSIAGQWPFTFSKDPLQSLLIWQTTISANQMF